MVGSTLSTAMNHESSIWRLQPGAVVAHQTKTIGIFGELLSKLEIRTCKTVFGPKFYIKQTMVGSTLSRAMNNVFNMA